jgi:hypothetical protein
MMTIHVKRKKNSPPTQQRAILNLIDGWSTTKLMGLDGTESWDASEDRRVKDRVDPFCIFNVLSSVMSPLEEMVARTAEPSYVATTRVAHDFSCSVLTAIDP